MAIEDVFEGARTALIIFDAYVNTVAQEIGRERAMSLLAKTAEDLGIMQGTMMKKQPGIREVDAKAAWPLLKSVPQSLGISLEMIEETPQRAVAKVGIGKCSVYEAAQMLEMDAVSIEAMCCTGPERLMNAAAKQLNPKLSFRVRKFRSSPQDFCEEEVILG